MNKIYKTELHCHTSEVSPCAHISGEETVEKYIAHGFTSVAITNHFDSDRIGAPMSYRVRYDTYEEQVNRHYDAIDKIREIAEDRLNIIEGVEMCTCHNSNHYLVFGMDRKLALAENLFGFSMKELREYLNANGCVIIQSHPMRPGMTIVNPDFVDGYEVYNGSFDMLKYNEVAECYARVAGEGRKILTAGNDHHLKEEELRGSVITREPILDGAHLVRVLKSGDYEIHVDDN